MPQCLVQPDHKHRSSTASARPLFIGGEMYIKRKCTVPSPTPCLETNGARKAVARWHLLLTSNRGFFSYIHQGNLSRRGQPSTKGIRNHQGDKGTCLIVSVYHVPACTRITYHGLVTCPPLHFTAGLCSPVFSRGALLHTQVSTYMLLLVQ